MNIKYKKNGPRGGLNDISFNCICKDGNKAVFKCSHNTKCNIYYEHKDITNCILCNVKLTEIKKDIMVPRNNLGYRGRSKNVLKYGIDNMLIGFNEEKERINKLRNKNKNKLQKIGAEFNYECPNRLNHDEIIKDFTCTKCDKYIICHNDRYFDFNEQILYCSNCYYFSISIL
jgi:hypothetical protein